MSTGNQYDEQKDNERTPLVSTENQRSLLVTLSAQVLGSMGLGLVCQSICFVRDLPDFHRASLQYGFDGLYHYPQRLQSLRRQRQKCLKLNIDAGLHLHAFLPSCVHRCDAPPLHYYLACSKSRKKKCPATATDVFISSTPSYRPLSLNKSSRQLSDCTMKLRTWNSWWFNPTSFSLSSMTVSHHLFPPHRHLSGIQPVMYYPHPI